MGSETVHTSFPQFVFICGAVGSGNTFLFSCLAEDENVYGINEDALGATLERFIESERAVGKCPHSIEAFVGFLRALRHDRRTLILKTPSNLRRIDILRKHLPEPRFIMMIREPHAAIVSGLARHADATVEKAARTWLSDCRYFAEMDGTCLAVTFEELACDPVAVMERVSQRVLPLSQSVFTYARRMHRPERAAPERWKSKVDADVSEQVAHWVELLELEKAYRSIASRVDADLTCAAQPNNGARNSALLRPFIQAKKEFFRAWYRLRR